MTVWGNPPYFARLSFNLRYPVDSQESESYPDPCLWRRVKTHIISLVARRCFTQLVLLYRVVFLRLVGMLMKILCSSAFDERATALLLWESSPSGCLQNVFVQTDRRPKQWLLIKIQLFLTDASFAVDALRVYVSSLAVDNWTSAFANAVFRLAVCWRQSWHSQWTGEFLANFPGKRAYCRPKNGSQRHPSDGWLWRSKNLNITELRVSEPLGCLFNLRTTHPAWTYCDYSAEHRRLLACLGTAVTRGYQSFESM